MNTDPKLRLGTLALRYCGCHEPLRVWESGAGFYIGVRDPDTGEPISRESAQRALDSGFWTQRLNP